MNRCQLTLKAAKRQITWLPMLLIATLLFLSSCAGVGQASQPQKPPIKAGTPSPSPTTITSTDPTLSDQNTEAELALQRKAQGPNGWMWRISLPTNRLVLYYGNPLSSAMGPIGAYSDDELIARLQQQAQVYADLDPAHPVVTGLDYVSPVAQPVPMADGSWTYRMPNDSIEHYIDLANANQSLFFFDMQIGHSTVQKEVTNVWPYLERPGVDLSLDPEFDMAPGDIPGVEFGRMYASEINWVIDQLSNLVETQHLPEKILIIHQFRESMLPDWQKIRVQPGVEIVTSVDGFGTPGEKIDDYQIFDKEQLIEYPGFKLFYNLDKPLMTPQDVLALDPPPLMVMYQ
ncbi:MAG TPA: hypothetical protein VKV20_02355 [Ktedonobacteraceae bacterium]|nr:hypothetical protein [Ktedonobacteraceae bacterium]